MGIRRTSLHRPPPARSYRKLFLVVCEGSVTELEYFRILRRVLKPRQVTIYPVASGRGASGVLKEAHIHISKEEIGMKDEAWIVVDRDDWLPEQLNILHQWENSRANYGLAVSNPKFEFWLLLHFDDGHEISTVGRCDAALKKHMPTYNKHLDERLFPRETILQAVNRAQNHDNPPCFGWPKHMPCTTVYRLVKNILLAEEVVTT